MKSKSYFLSQPHQPFFVLAVINAILFMAIFLFSFNSLLNLSINLFDFHAYGMIFFVFTPAFLGFLFTTFPRFSQTLAINQVSYLRVFYILVGATVLYLLGVLAFPLLVILAKTMVMVVQLYALIIFINIYNISPLNDKHDQFYIMFAWIMGILSNVMFIIDIALLKGVSIRVGVFLYLIFLAFSVAQRMVPFFSHKIVQRDEKLLRNLALLFVAVVLVGFYDDRFSFLFLILAGLLLLKEMFRWSLPFIKSQPILWILHIAVYWLSISLIFGGFVKLAELVFKTSFLSLDIHFVVLGFLTTILIGFGTRVTLGHSGNLMVVDKYTKIVFYLTQIVLYFRVIYSFSGSSMLFYITALLWILLFSMWGFRYLPVLIFGKRLNLDHG